MHRNTPYIPRNAQKFASPAPFCPHCHNINQISLRTRRNTAILPTNHWMRASRKTGGAILCPEIMHSVCETCQRLGHTRNMCPDNDKVKLIAQTARDGSVSTRPLDRALVARIWTHVYSGRGEWIDSEPESDTDSDSDSESEFEPDAKSDSKPKYNSKPKIATYGSSEGETESETDSDYDSEPEPESEYSTTKYPKSNNKVHTWTPAEVKYVLHYLETLPPIKLSLP
jgi:hypothetical protein